MNKRQRIPAWKARSIGVGKCVEMEQSEAICKWGQITNLTQIERKGSEGVDYALERCPIGNYAELQKGKANQAANSTYGISVEIVKSRVGCCINNGDLLKHMSFVVGGYNMVLEGIIQGY